nr:reverse transcriptase domain-containing protein [Tanacetum cinerariifolium]
MRTQSRSRNNSPQREASPAIVEPLRIELPFLKDQFHEDTLPESPMADNRTMAELLLAPTEGYEDAIVISEITANNFELKHSGNFLDKMPRECLKIIKSKSKVSQSRAKAVVAKVGTSSSTPVISSDVAKLKDMVKALLLDKKNQSATPTPSTNPTPVKASQGQTTQNQCQNIQNQYQNLQNQMATLTDMMSKLVSANTASSFRSGTLPGNIVTNPKEELKGITTRSDVAYQGPKTPSPSKQETKVTKDQVQNPSSQNTAPVQPSVI